MNQPVMSRQQEKALLLEIKQGNAYALESLMMRYEERVFQFILRLVNSRELAEEITQDVFVKIWEGREHLGKIDSIGAWMYTLGKNKAINLLKELTARAAREEYYAKDRDWSIGGEIESEEKGDIFSLVDEAVAQMPEKCQQIFILKRDEGLSNEEIADRYNLSIHTVKNQLKKSYAILRKSIVEQTLFLILYSFLSNR
ncbi:MULTISPECIES: RNA polymerase sigma-70 factor [Olivibacter]|uniref:RNA polymerase, sigma-24 subunit, ECF subfamily n=2 Tax=Sphingobacteriaceae TaxID=84566 RepID=F4CAV5_SPHS2|nr:RNA polymerase sigma-70 factor [Pseudosphingobacterium sp.]